MDELNLTGKRRATSTAASAGSVSLVSLMAVALINPGHTALGEEPVAGQPDPALPAGVDCSDEVAPEESDPVLAEECPSPASPEQGSGQQTGSQTEEPPESGQEPASNPDPPPAAEQPPKPSSSGKPGGGKAGGGGGGRGSGKAEDRDDSPGGTGGDRGTGGTGSARGDGASAPEPRVGSTYGSGYAGTPAVVTNESPIPSFLLPIYEECGRRYGIPWRILAAINQVETAFGSNLNVSSAGAMGWMQFIPSSWSAYGVDANGDGRRDPYDPEDAICAAGNYLRAAGAHTDMRRAIFAYNHADWYVDMVLALARSYADVEITDPLPPAKRLDRAFARELARTARHHGVDWALVLAVLRAQGERGRTPASPGVLRETSRRLAAERAERGLRDRVRALVGDRSGHEAAGRDVGLLARYNRAVGLRGLVEGLNGVRDRLRGRVLDSKEIQLYPGGRQDVADGRIDPRILALLLYLAEGHDEVVITSLISGHGYYARPGVPSAHVFGQAVDIASIDGVSLLGGQNAGSPAERAVRDMLALPKELQPAQLISLFDFGGPSFAAADHHDHIHVGY